MPKHVEHQTTEQLYTEQLLRSVGRLRFPEVVEREFQESFFNPRAHAFITKWGLIPAVLILLVFCAGDFLGFRSNLATIECIRFISIVPVVLLYIFRTHAWVYRHIRDIYTVYLTFLSCTVAVIIAISPDTDFAHRGYMLSFPMLIMTTFFAKPRLMVATLASIAFCLSFDLANVLLDFKPLGFSAMISMVHFNMVMFSSLLIGLFTCYVLEVAERREFLQRKIIDQDKELILLQQFELSEAVDQLTVVNERLEVQNDSLDKLNQEKSVFLEIAAHDLKNPLSGISLNIAGIKRYVHKMSETELIAAMDRVDQAATRMKELVVQLLDISHLESGTMEVSLRRLNVLEHITRVQNDYRERARKKHIEIIVECAQDMYCIADSSLLSQVMDNLVSNAIKFSPEDRCVYLKASESDIHGEAAVSIVVQNEGPGFAADDIQKLFQRYQKLSAKPTGGEHSSGLGLSIVKKMVDLMDGVIHCESVAGKGAQFIVKIPNDHHSAARPMRIDDVGVLHSSQSKYVDRHTSTTHQ